MLLHHYAYLLNPFSSFFYTHVLLSYCVLFFFIFLEGEIALIIGGIFVHLGILSLWVTILLTIVAAFCKMFAGYGFGAYLGRKYPNSKFFKYIERKILYFLPHFRERPFWSIVLSKFIYGVNNAALLFSGYVQADFGVYMRAEMLSSLVWLGAMFGLGLFFSASALAISHNFHAFSMLIILFVIGFIILHRILNLVIEIVEDLSVKDGEK